MILTTPMPFREALDAHAVKSILPSTGRTADLSRLDPAIKRRAMMSATVALAKPLQALRTGVDGILSGTVDQASVRLDLKQLWQDLGYEPDPAQAGSLQDLGSTDRINLQIETNVATARGAGWYEQGMQPDVLDEFPCAELVDTSPGDRRNRRDIAARWAASGGKFYGGRMIAPKTDRIWSDLADPARFSDGLGNPYDPLWFNTHWRQRDIARDEAESLGVIEPGTQLTPEPLDLSADLAAEPALREQWLRDAIVDSGVGAFDARGTLVFSAQGGGQ